MNFKVLAFDPAGKVALAVVAALATNFAHKSPSPQLRLALRVWRRSTSEVVRLGGALHLPEAMVLLSLCSQPHRSKKGIVCPSRRPEARPLIELTSPRTALHQPWWLAFQIIGH